MIPNGYQYFDWIGYHYVFEGPRRDHNAHPYSFLLVNRHRWGYKIDQMDPTHHQFDEISPQKNILNNFAVDADAVVEFDDKNDLDFDNDEDDDDNTDLDDDVGDDDDRDIANEHHNRVLRSDIFRPPQ